MKDMVIVDNLVSSFAYQLENGIPIIEWYCDKQDSELLYLASYLRDIA
jgi:TFIIF-interacting CTD phosphatase-like protein